MLPEYVKRAIDEQYGKEVETASLYTSMSNFLRGQGYEGMAEWLAVQSLEEMEHAGKFEGYLRTQDEVVAPAPPAMPPSFWQTPLEVFQAGLEQEEAITQSIHELAGKVSGVDLELDSLLEWFISEQEQERANFNDVVGRLQAASDSIELSVIDRELGASRDMQTGSLRIAQLSEGITKLLEEQYEKVMASAGLYTSMANFLWDLGYEGMGEWMMVQSIIEGNRTIKFDSYLRNQGQVMTTLMDTPPAGAWHSPLDVFRAGLDHVREMIRSVRELTDKVSGVDSELDSLLAWFTNEYLKEESSLDEIVGKLYANVVPMDLLDRELGMRQLI